MHDKTADQQRDQNTSSDRADPDARLKRLQIIIAILASVVAILTGIIGLILLGRKGMAWAVFTPLEAPEGRERLMKLIHAQLDSTAGHETIASYALAHFQTKGRKDFQGFFEDLLVLHSKAQDVINKGVSVARDAAPEGKREEIDRAVQESTIAERSEKPLTSEEDTPRYLERLAADLRAQLKKSK